MALSVEEKIAKQLQEAGTRLLTPPSSVDELLPILDEVEVCLEHVEQSPSKTMQDALSPLKNALVAQELLGHSDPDVKVSVATCINEITRITAPDAPYNDDQMKEIFQLIVSSFEKLHDMSSRSYKKRTTTLETVARVRSCVVMLDLECDALILEMFQHFLKSVRENHPETVFTSMETIMTLVLEESEDISPELLSPILEYLKKDNKNVNPVARRLGESVLIKCASKVKPYLVQAIKTLGMSLDDYSNVVASVCQDLSGAVELNGVNIASNNEVNQVDLPNPSSEAAVKVVEETLEDTAFQDEVSPAPDNLESRVSNGSLQKVIEEAEVAKEDLTEQKHDECTEDKVAEESSTSKVETGLIIKPQLKEESSIKRGRNGNLSKSTGVEEAEVVREDLTEQKCDDHIETKVAEESDTRKVETDLIIKSQPNKKSNKKRGRKGNFTKSTLESSEATHVMDDDAEEVTNVHESESKDDGSLHCEDTPAVSLTNSEHEADIPHQSSEKEADIPHPLSKGCEKEADIPHPNSEKEAGIPHPLSKGSENEAVDVASPSQSVGTAEGSHLKKTESENKTVDVVQEAGTSHEGDSIKDSDADASGLKEDKIKLKETSSATDNEENIPGPVGASSKKDDGITIDSDTKTTKLSSKKMEPVSDQKNEKMIKRQRKATLMKDNAKPTPKKESKESLSSPKVATKSAKKEPFSASSKRKRAGAKEKASEIDKHGEELVGSRIEVWWPQDKKFYKGVVELFNSSDKTHKVLYDDGDMEVLRLKDEKWNFIKDDSDSGKGLVSDDENPDTSSEIQKKKKIKTNPDQSSKQGSSVTAKKRVGGTSLSRSKVAVSKPGSKKSKEMAIEKTSDDEDAKTGGGSEDENDGKSSDSDSGDESMDETPKGADKSKEEDFKTPKRSSKSKQTAKGTTRSKGKTAKGSGSKSTANKTGKGKASSSTSKGKESDTTKKSQKETAKSSQSGKGKSSSTSSKAQKTETKSESNKRKRGSNKK